MRLGDLHRCFESIIPSIVATCSADGVPNVGYISNVQYVDERHLALSHQFFNKTRRNINENPTAVLLLLDPHNSDQYKLALRYSHAETSGPLFDTMSLRIDAIASQTGLERVFKLLAADVYEVTSIEQSHDVLRPDAPPPHPPGAHLTLNGLGGLRTLSERINRAVGLEALLDSVLEVMEGLFDFRHSMVLVPDDGGERLVTVASRGYSRTGAGAEVKIGEGIIGTVARARRLLRLSSVDRDLRYARASGDDPGRAEIPLPGLPNVDSQMAVPLVVGDELVGVLAVESPRALEFGEAEESFLSIVANQVALAMQRIVARDEELDPEPDLPAPVPTARQARTRHRFCFYANDDVIFVDDQYLVRNVPGRILWKLLRAHASDGRHEFSNRELRLDPWLGLPSIKDNLESRIILLRKRLAEKLPDVRLAPRARGRFALEIDCEVVLEERATG